MDSWIGYRCFGREARDVLVPVPSRRKKIGKHNHKLGPLFDAARKGGGDRRLGEFHVSRFDDRPLGVLAERVDDFQQELVAFIAPRAVVDKYDGDFFGWDAEVRKW